MLSSEHHLRPLLSAVLELTGPRKAAREPLRPALCEVGFCPLMSRWVPGMPWEERNSWGFLRVLKALLMCGCVPPPVLRVTAWPPKNTSG